MKSILFLVLALVAATQVLLVTGATIATSVDTASGAPAVDALPYPVVDAVISGEVNGVKYLLNGSLASVAMALKKQYPNLTADEFLGTAASVNGFDFASDSGLRKRSKIWPPRCFPRGHQFQTTNAKWVNSLVGSLSRDITRTVGTDPWSCTYIDCNHDAQLFVCNHNDWFINSNLVYLASYARDTCGHHPCKYFSFLNGMQCGGEMWDSDNYNVIIRRRSPDDGRICLRDVVFDW